MMSPVVRALFDQRAIQPLRLPSDGVKDERYPTTGRDEDSHRRAALGSADAAER
jgi:hypothetical protein